MYRSADGTFSCSGKLLVELFTYRTLKTARVGHYSLFVGRQVVDFSDQRSEFLPLNSLMETEMKPTAKCR